MIYSLYGQSGSGKTTIAERLKEKVVSECKALGNHCSVLWLDGDKFRERFVGHEYGIEGRIKNIKNLNAVATYLSSDYTDIIISFVNPYMYLREDLKKISCKRVIEIYLYTDRDDKKKYHVDDFEKGEPDYKLNTDDQDDSANFQKLAREMWLGTVFQTLEVE
jgi:adenylylsulfate kinase-like enzyme